MAVAVEQFMGPAGYWLIVVGAILSTLSALGANVLAASRIAFSMANDRTLPTILRRTSKSRGTPVMAVTTSALIICALLMMMPDLTAAGSAASLIFLVAFTLAHVTAILARKRGGGRERAFRTPLFPLLPAFGAAACALLALFQAVMVPAAGVIALFWLGLGVIFYLSLFASRAELLDASAEAYDPDLVRLRGRSPLVLLPIANPSHAASMVAVAHAIAPPVVGRVLVLTIVSGEGSQALAGLGDAQKVIAAALTESHAGGRKVEALVSTAPTPWAEIERVAGEHQCESLLLGIGELTGALSEARIERLANTVECDVAILRAPLRWQIDAARRVLVPMGGRGEQHGLRARMLGSLLRAGPREVTFMRVVREAASAREVEAAFREVERKAEDSVPGEHSIEIVQSNDPRAAILEEARSYDLVVLGFHRDAGRARFGAFAKYILQRASCATIVLSAKR
jgi:nucleotide-binding universal stress UspA family protein